MSTEAALDCTRAKVDRTRLENDRTLDRNWSSPFSAATPNSFVISHGRLLAQRARVSKRFVYILRNHESPSKYYTGLTSDVVRRHAERNAGSCTHTAKHRPWSLDVVIEFADERRVVAFERYLKSGSGVAFAQRHLR